MPPHPSGMVPHSAPISEQVIEVHPHFFETPPPPQVAGASHWPQWMVPPHPSGALPQLAPRSAQVIGVQPRPPSVDPPVPLPDAPPVPVIEPLVEADRKPSKS
jgi:hypothetical protein